MDGAVAEAYRQLERLRWGEAPQGCPHCAAPGRCVLLSPRGGVRRTRTGARTERRVWRCGACRRQFSVLTGTVLAGTRVPLPVVLAALADWARSGRPTAAALAARHGITGEAARHLLRRVDAAVLDRRRAGVTAEPLAAVVGLPPERAAQIRRRTPARLRPRRQVGPTADHGTG